MNTKRITIFLIFLFQFIISCDSCDCSPSKTFERRYNKLTLKSWDTTGFRNNEIKETANKDSFGITINVESELNQISLKKSKFNIKSIGFSSAYACDCVGDKYINTDSIKSIIIKVINTKSKEEKDVTNNFYTYNYNDEQIPINEILKNKADWHDGFQIDMLKQDSIPDYSVFRITIALESGKELIEETKEIKFK